MQVKTNRKGSQKQYQNVKSEKGTKQLLKVLGVHDLIEPIM